jgi:hypothetical protein
MDPIGDDGVSLCRGVLSGYKKWVNTFSLGAQVGGAIPDWRERSASEQYLRNLMNEWSGKYTNSIREFAFLLRIDGDIHEYTRMWNIVGAQPAKRKRDCVEVEIGIPMYWYPQHRNLSYKQLLAAEVEKGLHSMVALLQRNKHLVDSQALFADWAAIKQQYLLLGTKTH